MSGQTERWEARRGSISQALIEKLSQALHKASDEWEWNFSYAPKPGQQRVKIVAKKIGSPELCRTLVFTEELCKTLPMPELVQHVMRLLPQAPKTEIARPFLRSPTPFKPTAPQPITLELEYQSMRKSYERNVTDLKEEAIAANRPTSWLHFFGLTLRNLSLGRR